MHQPADQRAFFQVRALLLQTATNALAAQRRRQQHHADQPRHQAVAEDGGGQ